MSKQVHGTVTGSKLKQSNRGKKGGITGSKHFDAPATAKEEIDRITQENDRIAREGLLEHFQNAATNIGDTVQSISKTGKTIQRAFGQGSSLVTDDSAKALNIATEIASQRGIELTDIDARMRVSNDDIDTSLGEGISAKELNQKKLTIQKQNNLLDLRRERLKQKREIVSLYREELGLVGDLVDVGTLEVKVGEKVVNHQIAVTEFETVQSKLEQKEELLIQQQISTQGSINLTEGIREDWRLKHQLLLRHNEESQLKIEGMIRKNSMTRLELESLLFDE
jgi:ABC-type sugar transport system ATPase subunit